MSSSWRELPGSARAIARCVDDAVTAARSADRDAYQRATEQLAALNPEQAGVVLGAVIRSSLEDLHPDGLAGDDVRAVLVRCVSAAIAWYPAVDGGVLGVLVVGALGVHDAEPDQRPVSPLEMARHAPLLVAQLLAETGRSLDGYLRAAFAEIARAETVELP